MNSEYFNNLGGRGRIDYAGESKNSAIKIVKGASGGRDPFTVIIGAVVGAVDAAFSWGSAGKRAKIDEERYRQELIGELFEEKKTNWTPILIVGGVLIAGGIATYIALKD